MSAGETGGGAQVKSAVRTVELPEYFTGRPGIHSLASVQEAVGYPKSSLYMLPGFIRSASGFSQMVKRI